MIDCIGSSNAWGKYFIFYEIAIKYVWEGGGGGGRKRGWELKEQEKYRRKQEKAKSEE